MRSIASLAFCVALTGGQAFAACNSDLLSIAEWSARSLDDQTIEVAITVRSQAEKPIRMVAAEFGFKDALGGHVAADSFDRDLTIPAKGTVTTIKNWPMTFERLLKLKHDEVAVSACVYGVVYEDGTKEEFK
ncbi:hypothetical protein JVX98_12795 [Ensifer sp. PDNC004]|uniref:hypothetical protein n=1 Tax=Ensifer sp. PDNC004 TaxID=2811423 RepID=UPI00196544F6|nr:hypothetical protein [Ensifer sp. PDNC004]QRY69103.1 hypothetical protein JVX98_12795 [Ensifer sp. PDNC004]